MQNVKDFFALIFSTWLWITHQDQFIQMDHIWSMKKDKLTNTNP
jgi:hypothetical protein